MAKKLTLRYVEDPGHGWAEVPETLCKSLGLGTDFAQRNGQMYLEEDCEMQDLEAALTSAGYDWSYAACYVDDFDSWLGGSDWPDIPKE